MSDLFICIIFIFRLSVGFICLIFSPISCSIFLSDLFQLLIRVDLYVRFFVRFHVRFLPDIFVRHVLVRFFSDFLIRFHVRFLPDFCPIFYVRFSLSDFLCPILLSYFCPIYFIRRVYVRFFILFSLSDFLPYFCPIRCLVFLSSFLADLLSHFLCDFSSKKMEHVSSSIATFVMYYQCVSVFIIMTVSYCTHLRGCDIAAATSGFGRDPGTLRNSLRLEKKT